MEFPGKKTSCMKVDDPYFGKRKPSANLKRIHRKISYLESQKNQRHELNQGRLTISSSSSFRIRNDGSNSSLNEMQNNKFKSRSNENLKNAAAPQQQRASTAPGALTTSSISADKWPTKDEFVSLLFRMI